jgi:glucosyl-3-phosphoglycerate synthase
MTATRLVLILTSIDSCEDWLKLAIRMAGEDGIVYVRGSVTVPADKSPSEYASQAQSLRAGIDPTARSEAQIDDDVRVYVDHDPVAQVIEEITREGHDIALVQWAGLTAITGGATTDILLDRLPCDVVLLTRDTWQVQRDVLLSLRGGPNLTLGVRTAKALCGDSSITLFHAADKRPDMPELEVVMRAEQKIRRAITARSDIAAGILAEARDHSVIVMGAGLRQPENNERSRYSVLEKVSNSTSMSIALIRARQSEALFFHPPIIRHEQQDISTRVDRWFAENTFHSEEFADIGNLVALKEKRGLTISLGLPALNEEKTVEKVIRTLKGALMDDAPLLDQIVLIDSNSTDNTIPLALSCGIPVHKHPDLLPEHGSVRGKGEALWKSLSILKGDIIAWVDTDITNIHPRFVYGLLGPLLKYPRLQYIKGYYQRPIQVGDKLHAYGGGRVTELVARPMFNLFFPELSGFIQPLSGEYAGRRQALEQVPFFTGYGVETGLLIDLFTLYGLDGLAQVDLDVRVHHNQPLVGLSKMAFAILQVFMARLESRFGVQLVEGVNRSMKMVIQEPERFALDVETITELERPPMSLVLGEIQQKSPQPPIV